MTNRYVRCAYINWCLAVCILSAGLLFQLVFLLLQLHHETLTTEHQILGLLYRLLVR